MSPLTPAGAWWMWAASAGSPTRRTPMLKQTLVSLIDTVATPKPSRSPAPGAPLAPISLRPFSRVASAAVRDRPT